jgi:hypothetical protein
LATSAGTVSANSITEQKPRLLAIRQPAKQVERALKMRLEKIGVGVTGWVESIAPGTVAMQEKAASSKSRRLVTADARE